LADEVTMSAYIGAVIAMAIWFLIDLGFASFGSGVCGPSSNVTKLGTLESRSKPSRVFGTDANATTFRAAAF